MLPNFLSINNNTYAISTLTPPCCKPTYPLGEPGLHFVSDSVGLLSAVGLTTISVGSLDSRAFSLLTVVRPSESGIYTHPSSAYGTKPYPR